jgi:hypothetical protein
MFTAPLSSPGFGEYRLPILPGVQYLLINIKMPVLRELFSFTDK